MNGAAWSLREDRLIARRVRQGLSSSAIAALLPKRTLSAVKARLKLQRVRRYTLSGRPIEQTSAWTADEVARLYEMREAFVPTREIAARLGRTVSAVNGKWSKLERAANGATKPWYWSMKRIAALLGVSQQIARDWLVYGWLPAARSGRWGGTEWAISAEQLHAFLGDQRYWPIWSVEQITDPVWRDLAREMRGTARYLTTKAVAARVGVSAHCIQQHCRAGRLPCVVVTSDQYQSVKRPQRRFYYVADTDLSAVRQMLADQVNSHAKLTWEQVDLIRATYRCNERGVGIESLARRYGVAKATVADIVSGRTWTKRVGA